MRQGRATALNRFRSGTQGDGGMLVGWGRKLNFRLELHHVRRQWLSRPIPPGPRIVLRTANLPKRGARKAPYLTLDSTTRFVDSAGRTRGNARRSRRSFPSLVSVQRIYLPPPRHARRGAAQATQLGLVAVAVVVAVSSSSSSVGSTSA